MTNSKVCELINENNFKSMLTNELYALIDEELAKGDEMDCELIDELVLAIESLEQNEDENKGIIFPVIFGDASGFSKRVINKVNNRNRLMQLTAWAAVIAILCSSANELLLRSENTTLVNELSKMVQKVGQFLTSTFDNNSDKEETTTTPSEETTTIPTEEITTPSEEIVIQNNNTQISAEKRMLKLELISGDKFKTSYLWQEKLDLTGLKVVAVYSDDSREEISIDDCEISGFNPLKVGEQTINVKHNGLVATFKITVSRTEQNNETTRIITNIEINTKAEEIIVPKGTENPAYYERVQYRYAYSDGTFSPWKVCKDAELISEYDPWLIDVPQELTYRTPEGWEFAVNVIVYDNTVPEELEVIRLEVSRIPAGMKYYPTNLYKCYTYVGEGVDFTQFELKVKYEDGSFKHKTLADSKIQAYGTMTTDRPSSSKGYTITFAYGNATVDFKYDVLIKPEIQAWFVNETRWDVYYINDAPQEYDAATLVTATMTDSNEKIYLDVEVKGYDPTKLGFIELEIYYNGEKLCDYLGGFIYGDTGYAVTQRPITDGESLPSKLNYTPYVIANKCIGDGKFETYADIKYQLDDDPVNDPSIYFQSGTAGELRAMGITSYNVRCIDHAIVEYKISADQKINEIGTHTAQVYLYNTKTNDNGWSYQRDGVYQDLSYTLTIKEKPSYYAVDAPNNIKINIQDIYSEFYDKLHVYAVYEDGRKEEIFDYTVTRFSPSRETTSEKLNIFIRYPSGQGMYKYVYVYNDGYEDSFYVTATDYRQDKENYYAVGDTKPYIKITFSSASQEELDSLYSTSFASQEIEKWDIEGWDTSTPGEKEATIIYHSPIGDLKTIYKYFVIPEYNTSSIRLTFTNGQEAYDVRYGFIDGTYEIKFIDVVGRFYDLTDYTISYDKSIWTNGQYFIPAINYTSPVDNKTYKSYFDKIERIGDVKSVTAQRLENGDAKITVETLYTPQNGYLKYRFYICGKYVYADTDSNIAEVIIPKSQWAEGDSKTYNLTAYIIDDESGEWYISREYQQAKVTIE